MLPSGFPSDLFSPWDSGFWPLALPLVVPRILAAIVGLGSVVWGILMLGVPGLGRSRDLLGSGLGLFYGAVLWFGAGQFQEVALLGQGVGTLLMLALGSQALVGRWALVPEAQKEGMAWVRWWREQRSLRAAAAQAKAAQRAKAVEEAKALAQAKAAERAKAQEQAKALAQVKAAERAKAKEQAKALAQVKAAERAKAQGQGKAIEPIPARDLQRAKLATHFTDPDFTDPNFTDPISATNATDDEWDFLEDDRLEPPPGTASPDRARVDRGDLSTASAGQSLPTLASPDPADGLGRIPWEGSDLTPIPAVSQAAVPQGSVPGALVKGWQEALAEENDSPTLEPPGAVLSLGDRLRQGQICQTDSQNWGIPTPQKQVTLVPRAVMGDDPRAIVPPLAPRAALFPAGAVFLTPEQEQAVQAMAAQIAAARRAFRQAQQTPNPAPARANVRLPRRPRARDATLEACA